MEILIFKIKYLIDKNVKENWNSYSRNVSCMNCGGSIVTITQSHACANKDGEVDCCVKVKGWGGSMMNV